MNGQSLSLGSCTYWELVRLVWLSSLPSIPQTALSGNSPTSLSAKLNDRKPSSSRPSAATTLLLKTTSMPKLRPLLPTQNHSWTKVPNILFDKLMPTLKDTELRVLLASIRATSGWNRDGRTSILSYQQLMKRTGRRSEAIARALRHLQSVGLIHRPVARRHRITCKPNVSDMETEEQQYKDKDRKRTRGNARLSTNRL